MRRPHLIIFFCLLLVPFLGCERRSVETPQVRIGLLVDLDNVAASSAVAVAELAVRELEEAGGLKINGVPHRVVIKVAPTDETPEGAARAMQHLLQKEEVVAVVGPIISHNALAAAPLAEKARIPMITQGATHPQVTHGKRFVFRTNFSDPMLVDAMVRFLVDDLKIHHAAVLYDISSVYSRTVAERFQEKFLAPDRRVTAEHYLSGAETFIEQLERLRVSDAEILLLPNYTASVIVQAQEARALGLDLPLIGSDSWMPEILADVAALEGSYLLKAWHYDLAAKDEQTRHFIHLYRQAQREEPLSETALTWDTFHLIFDAIRRADSADPEKLRDAIADTSGFHGVSGEITLRGTNGDPHKAMVVLRLENQHAILHRVVR